MNDNDFQNLTRDQLVIIMCLALRKIRTDIAFLKWKVDHDDTFGSANLLDCGILQGLIQAQSAFHDVYYSGILESSGGADNE